MDPSKQEIAARIKAARVQKGWKQKHLAAAAHVEPMTVSHWERGATTPDFDALSLIAEATGKPLNYFLPESEESEVSSAQLEEAVARLEAVADQLAVGAERMSAMLTELRSELRRLR